MKHEVLIIANLWPPNNSTGVYRTKGFVEFLHRSGYHPVLITQNWGQEAAEQPYIKEEHENYEVYRVSCGKYNNRRVMDALNNRKWTILRRAYNFFDRFLWVKGIWWFQDFRFMLQVSLKIAKEKNIKKAVVISDPFQLYFIGYQLNRKLGVKWIADYRDAWNTMEFSDTATFKESSLNNFLKKLERAAEKRWVGTASYITAVSDHYAQRIAAFVNVPCETIYNGFFLKEQQLFQEPAPTEEIRKDDRKLVIVYNGTLYPAQKIEIFLEGYREFIDRTPGASIEVRFIGLNTISHATERVTDLMKGYEDYYTITDRISKLALIEEIKQADAVLLLTQGPEHKGVATSKIFDYLVSSKPVICCPTDCDVVEKILKESGQGLFANTVREVTALLVTINQQMKEMGTISVPYNKNNIKKYSREHQAGLMANLLKKI